MKAGNPSSSVLSSTQDILSKQLPPDSSLNSSRLISQKTQKPAKIVQNFPSIYHLAQQIKENEKSKTKMLLKG